MKEKLLYAVPKRTLDILVSLTAMIVLSPVFLIVALRIKFDKKTSRIIYQQERVGLMGQPFKIYKFQTMVDNAEQILKSNPTLYQKFLDNGYKLPTKEDPRITSYGKFLRRTSLDELPQFMNVLRGDMTIIGPRPIVRDELKEYGNQIDTFLSVKPGVFGLWQAEGRSNIHYPQRAEIELEYVKRASLSFDFYVLFKNVIMVFKQDGAF
ncbi:sugar transferase [Convivina intestini]|uniref:Lipopolysaccharide/colanic/teichoic acid biosynthesis glycosyltransferase n=1 Tax=Convivina intestini TaxID=1505726 RepID=A0A2U1DC76_9LACO|nr:sugar transferase [Convivina intestini]PVY85293.1 lipopolysaccharide/colanic/teichoic acid biosynthesis glycosyltransferase [Convivina intestini]CAH1852775.1 UDP-glucose:undecaprenyl-phosphate glucose-1-phosphate transferase [Convivina intestini]SDB86639.1 Sugar transferase involved in LPS biosynthesis (colanic, teichoic acid) [Leuconostocaceae bacterium R-53105]